MMNRFRSGTVAVFTWVVIAGCAEASPIIFNDISRFDFSSSRGAGDSPIAAISVASATSNNKIGVYNDLNANGNLKFLIFNLDTTALLFQSAPQAFVDNGLSFKLSNSFAPFTLLSGITYGIGAIADVGGLWGINNASSGNPFTQNGITASDDRNGNVANFAAPSIVSGGTAMIIVELAGPATDTTVPEPATLLLLGSGAAYIAARRRRSRG